MRVPGSLKWVASGRNIVVGVNNGDYIYYRVGLSSTEPTGDRWIRASGRLAQIDVFGMTVTGVNRGGHNYKSPLQVRGTVLRSCTVNSYNINVMSFDYFWKFKP